MKIYISYKLTKYTNKTSNATLCHVKILIRMPKNNEFKKANSFNTYSVTRNQSSMLAP